MTPEEAVAIENQQILQLRNALAPYKGQDVSVVYDEFHTSHTIPGKQVVFRDLLALVSPESVARLMMWPSFTDFKDMVLNQDVTGLQLYTEALAYAGMITNEEAVKVFGYLSTISPETMTQAPIIVEFDWYALRGKYGDKAVGMPNTIPRDFFEMVFAEL